MHPYPDGRIRLVIRDPRYGIYNLHAGPGKNGNEANTTCVTLGPRQRFTPARRGPRRWGGSPRTSPTDLLARQIAAGRGRSSQRRGANQAGLSAVSAASLNGSRLRAAIMVSAISRGLSAGGRSGSLAQRTVLDSCRVTPHLPLPDPF